MGRAILEKRTGGTSPHSCISSNRSNRAKVIASCPEKYCDALAILICLERFRKNRAFVGGDVLSDEANGTVISPDLKKQPLAVAHSMTSSNDRGAVDHFVCKARRITIVFRSRVGNPGVNAPS